MTVTIVILMIQKKISFCKGDCYVHKLICIHIWGKHISLCVRFGPRPHLAWCYITLYCTEILFYIMNTFYVIWMTTNGIHSYITQRTPPPPYTTMACAQQHLLHQLILLDKGSYHGELKGSRTSDVLHK